MVVGVPEGPDLILEDASAETVGVEMGVAYVVVGNGFVVVDSVMVVGITVVVGEVVTL